MVLKRTFKCLIAVILKRTDCRLGSGSTATAVSCWLTVEEAEAGLLAADVPVVRQWWLEERQLVLVCLLVNLLVAHHRLKISEEA